MGLYVANCICIFTIDAMLDTSFLYIYSKCCRQHEKKLYGNVTMHISVTIRETEKPRPEDMKLLIIILVFRLSTQSFRSLYVMFNKHINARKFGRMFNYQEYIFC